MPDPAPPSAFRARVERVRRYVREEVWDERAACGGIAGRAVYAVRLLVLVVEGTLRDHILLRAGALTYKTVFSIVPLFAVMLAFFPSFGGGTPQMGDKFKQWALDQNLPGLGEVMSYLNESIAKVHAGAVGGVGLLLLLYTAISLLTTVEQSLNHIWGVAKGRGFFWRCIIYWGVLTLGPVVLMASLAATTFIQTSAVVVEIDRHTGVGTALVLEATPFVFAWFGFAAAYYFMPNTSVRWRSALVGGILGGTLWELAKHGFALYVRHSVTTFAIYGSLGMVPMFLLWLYVSWIIVLFGAEWAFAHQHVKTYRREIAAADVSPAAREELALQAMLHLARAFAAGAPPVTSDALAETVRVPVRLVNDVLSRLGAAGLVREVAGAERGYMPGRAPGTIPAKAVVDAVRRSGTTPEIGNAAADGAVRALLARAEDALNRELGAVTVEDLARTPRS